MNVQRLETGWLADTPIGDTLFRRFLHNQSELNGAIALAAGGRDERIDGASMADAGGVVPYLNESMLFRPLVDDHDPLLDELERFHVDGGRRPMTLLSIWPTPDLGGRGWTLVGHPAFVVRGPQPFDFDIPPAVDVQIATDAEALAIAERVVVDGYPLDEAKGLGPGAVLPPGILDTDVRYRIGFVDGEPVAAAGNYVGHGLVNLCLAATLPAARRRGVWQSLVWARVADAPDVPAVAYTSDFSRPGFERMGFVPLTRFTMWARQS